MKCPKCNEILYAKDTDGSNFTGLPKQIKVYYECPNCCDNQKLDVVDETGLISCWYYALVNGVWYYFFDSWRKFPSYATAPEKVMFT